MKALLIGGTGQISMAITGKLVKDGWEVYLLNRGNRSAELPESVSCCVNGALDDREDRRVLLVSLGMFSVIRIERPAQLLKEVDAGDLTAGE